MGPICREDGLYTVRNVYSNESSLQPEPSTANEILCRKDSMFCERYTEIILGDHAGRLWSELVAANRFYEYSVCFGTEIHYEKSLLQEEHVRERLATTGVCCESGYRDERL